MMFRVSACLVLSVFLSASLVSGQVGNCNIDERVRIALRTMSHSTVPKVVDCVVGSGPCDSTGSWIRNHARCVEVYLDIFADK